MFETVTSGLGGKLADRLAVVLLSPAFAFWALGGVAWTLTRPHAVDHAVSRLATLSGFAQGALIVGALLVATASSAVIQRTVPIMLRLLQGYWPAPLRSVLAARYRHRLAGETEIWEGLYPRWEEGTATATETAELQATERRLARLPATPEKVMPTRLGNVMRAAEGRPFDWYGLDSVSCWPRLWLLLPDPAKEEVTVARADLETAVTWWTWAALTAVWAIFTPWALLVTAVACLFSYLAMIGSAVRFCELVNAIYDVHRGLLYDALGYARPDSRESERDTGIALTRALLRGPV
jgi:hypothetical protein